MLSAVFKSAAGHHTSQDQSLNSLCTHSEMANVLWWLAYWTDDYLQWAQENISDTSNRQHLQDIDTQYNSTFEFVANHLNNEISDSERNSEEDTPPSVLFYLAAIFMWTLSDDSSTQNLLRINASSLSQELRSLLGALLQYATRTSGRKNDLLETRFAGENYSWLNGRSMDKFSEEWWDMLFEIGRDLGLKAAEQALEPVVTGGSDPNSRPSSSSQDEQKASDVIITPAGPSSPSIPLEVIETSLASNAPAPDRDIVERNEVSHGDPRPSSLTRAGSNLNDHDEDTKLQSLSDLRRRRTKP
ncbi:hypothetical protein BJ912DRAFT_968030 [Pholiota molesta]|nr:hypothetical protein BJ912DRAFT_968030 [Pholiota molesta]